MKTIFCAALMAVLMLSTTGIMLANGPVVGEAALVSGSSEPPVELSYVPHAPIRINGNADFVGNTSGGDGSAGNPWVIENFDINGTGYGYCIYIGNTTDNFTVRDCYLHDASGVNSYPYYPDSGLILNNVTFGIITNNTVSSNVGNGISLFSSSNNTVLRNRISHNGYAGVYTNGNGSDITENDFVSNVAFGVELDGGNGNRVFHNNFIGNRNSHMQGFDRDGSNAWDDGWPSGGNYWNGGGIVDRFSGPAQEWGGADGICDDEYPIQGFWMGLPGVYVMDQYPLVYPINNFAGVASTDITSHEDGDYVSGIITLKVDVVTNATYFKGAGIMFYVDGVNVGFEPTGNTFELDTTAYPEDSTIQVEAEVMFVNNPPMSDTVDLVINNVVDTGAFITAMTLDSTYSPDEVATLMVDVINSPPAFSKMRIEVNYTDPNGNVFNSSLIRNFAVPTYNLAINLRSDAVLGSYGVTVSAYGMIGTANIWAATTTTTFNVTGQNIHNFLSDIQSGIMWANYSIANLQDDMNYLNASSAASFASLSDQLAGVNASLSKSITGMNATFLDELQKVNVSLAADIQASLVTITSDIAGMNSTFLAELAKVNASLVAEIQAYQAATTTDIAGMNSTFLAELAKVNASLVAEIQAYQAAATTDITGMNETLHIKLNEMIATDAANQVWLNGVLTVLDHNVTQTNATLRAQMTALTATMNARFVALGADLDGVLAKLATHDGNLTRHNATIMAAIADVSDLVESSNQMTLDALTLRIKKLATNLSTVDAELSADLVAIAGDIEAFKKDTDVKLAGISTTLIKMDKLETIMKDLAGLDDDIQTAQTQLGDKIDSASMDQSNKLDTQALMMYVLIALVVVSLLINILLRPKPSKGKDESAGADDK